MKIIFGIIGAVIGTSLGIPAGILLGALFGVLVPGVMSVRLFRQLGSDKPSTD